VKKKTRFITAIGSNNPGDVIAMLIVMARNKSKRSTSETIASTKRWLVERLLLVVFLANCSSND